MLSGPDAIKSDNPGALTVVISPPVAPMADQVQAMARISSAATVNGMLSLPGRQYAPGKVRMGEGGDASDLAQTNAQRLSPLVLAQREVGLWVLDNKMGF